MSQYITPVIGISLRKILPVDAPKVRQLIFDVLTEYGLKPEPGATDADLFDIPHFYPDGMFWVLTDARDTIVGSAALYRLSDTTVELRKMYFLPGIRGKGLGNWLMHFVLSQAIKEGYQNIQLETATVLNEALKLYEKFGFKHLAATCHSPRCDVKMALDLTVRKQNKLPYAIVLKTDSLNEDFRRLVIQLDNELSVRDGAEHTFYHQYNGISDIRHTLVLYSDNEAVACGAFKAWNDHTAEIKRMFVAPAHRRRGYAAALLAELERWAGECGYTGLILETGKKQPEAISLYEKNGYFRIKNYGQYVGVENSVCFEKIMS